MKFKIGKMELKREKFNGKLLRRLLEVSKHLQEVGEKFGDVEIDMVYEFLAFVFEGQCDVEELEEEDWGDIQKLFTEVSARISGKVEKKSVNSKK